MGPSDLDGSFVDLPKVTIREEGPGFASSLRAVSDVVGLVEVVHAEVKRP